MGRAFHLASIELKRYFADRSDLAFSIALPVILFSLMVGALGGETAFHGTMHVADLDGGLLAQGILERVEDVDGVDVRHYSRTELADALERSAIVTGFVIPPGFSESIESGTPASITVEWRGTGNDEGRIVAGIVQGAARDAASTIALQRAVSVLADASTDGERIHGEVRRLLADARGRTPVAVLTESMDVRQVSQLDRLLPGIIVMFLLFSATLGARALVEERRFGTLERLMTTQLSASELFVGKFLAGVGRAMIQAFVFLGLAFAVLGVAGPVAFLQCLVLALVIAAAVTSIGLVIAALARTHEQASFAAVFVTMFMSMFGGTFFPTGGGWLDVLAQFSLNKHAVDAFVGLLSETANLADQWSELAVLTAVAVAGLVAARAMFRVSSATLQQ